MPFGAHRPESKCSLLHNDTSGTAPEDDWDSLLSALRVLRGSFPVSSRLPGVAIIKRKPITETLPQH